MAEDPMYSETTTDPLEGLSDELEIDGVEEEEELYYEDADPNLVDTFMEHPAGEEALKKISDQAFRDYESAWDASEEYRERVAADWRFFLSELPQKTEPYEGCANPNVPIMFEVLTRVHARAYAELFGDWSNVFGVVPVNDEDKEQAEIREKHDNWQLRSVITDFKRQMDRGLLVFLAQGDVVAESYYDHGIGRNCHDVLTPEEFFVPYLYVSTEPDFSDAPYYGRIRRMYRHELMAMETEAGWANVDQVIKRDPPPWSSSDDTPQRDAVSDIEGIQPTDDHGAYKIIYYYGWTRHLPDQPRDRFVKVVMDYDTKSLLSLTVHEEENWRDRMRYERQLQEYDAYVQAKEAHEQQMGQLQQRQERLRQELEDPLLRGPMRAQYEQEAAALSATPPPPPEPPDWMDMPEEAPPLGEEGEEVGELEMMGMPSEPPMPEPPRMEPIRMFSHGVCVEPPAGNLGIGYGRMLSDMNKAANVALAQFTDAASLGNGKMFLTAKGVRFPKDWQIQPGASHEITGVSGQDLNQAIKEISFGSANPQLVDIVSRMQQSAQQSVQAPEVLSGEPGKSGETYRGISARIEQATKQLSVTTRKYADFFAQIVKNNAKLNAVYLPENEIVEVTDPRYRNAQQLNVSRQMWENDYNVEIRADLRFASQAQRVQEADELVAMGAQNPVLMNNPEYMRRATVRALEARGEYELAKLVEQPPPPPPGPQGPPQGGPPNPGGKPPPGTPMPPSPGGPAPAQENPNDQG